MNELANLLKANVLVRISFLCTHHCRYSFVARINSSFNLGHTSTRAFTLTSFIQSFAGMPEEQVAALPPEVRTMIMAMVASGGGNGGGMMQPGMNMNGPMMGGMMPMGGMMDPTMMHQMGPGDMGMVGQGMGMGMGDGMGGQQMPGPGMGGQGMVGPSMNNGALSGGVAISSGGQGRATPDVPMGMMGDGFQGGPQGPQGMGMVGGNDFGMQVCNKFAKCSMYLLTRYY